MLQEQDTHHRNKTLLVTTHTGQVHRIYLSPVVGGGARIQARDLWSGELKVQWPLKPQC